MTDGHTHEITRWSLDWWLYWVIVPIGIIGGRVVTGLATFRRALNRVSGR